MRSRTRQEREQRLDSSERAASRSLCAALCHEHCSGLVRFTKRLKCACSPLCKGGVNDLQTIPRMWRRRPKHGAKQPEGDKGKRKALVRKFPIGVPEFRAWTDRAIKNAYPSFRNTPSHARIHSGKIPPLNFGSFGTLLSPVHRSIGALQLSTTVRQSTTRPRQRQQHCKAVASIGGTIRKWTTVGDVYVPVGPRRCGRLAGAISESRAWSRPSRRL